MHHPRYEQDGHAPHGAACCGDGESGQPFCQHHGAAGGDPRGGGAQGSSGGRTSLPPHRQWCVNKGCPLFCCLPRCRIFWILLLLLISVGAIVVMVIDLKFNTTYGSVLSRYQSQQGLITSVCSIEKYTVTDFESCICDEEPDVADCVNVARNYGCMQIFVKAYDYYTSAIVTNEAQLFRSDWEYALVKKGKMCFNLDICRIDMTRSWVNYKRKISYYIELFDQFRQDIGTFTCYIDYPESYKITPSALMELNTSFGDLFVWFILPILVVGVCWIGIVFACYWYGCPCAKKTNRRKYGGADQPKIYRDGGTTDMDEESDMSPSQSGYGVGHSGSNSSGGWPKSGPADADPGGSWPMYWR